MTSNDKIFFISTIGNIVNEVARERQITGPIVQVCIAQACLESGFGSSETMIKSNAPFGIKATKTWIKSAKYGGFVYNSKTKECYDGNTLTTITSCFRAYLNLKDAINDYFDLMHSKRYVNAVNCTTVEACITLIKDSGYATDPKYINKIMDIYNSYKVHIDCFAVESRSDKIGNMTYGDYRDLAYAVIRGEYGNGEERKKRLGSNYTIVQTIVNQLTKGGNK